MLGRVLSRLLLLLSPFVLAILSVDDLIADLFRSSEPTPIILTEMTGVVQKLSPADGIFRDVVVGETIEMNEQVLTHQDSSARLDLLDNWGIQMEPLSAITIQELSQGKNEFYTRVNFEIGTIDVSLSIGTLDVEMPSGSVSLHGPARAYLKVKMNSGETWAYCLEGDCILEKGGRRIGLPPGQTVTFSQYTDFSMTSETSDGTESCGPPPDWVIYIVKKGEKLKQLSEFYQVPISAIQLANCMGNSSNIKAGDGLFVPNKLIPTPTLIQLSTQEITQGIATDAFQPTATETPTPLPTSTPYPAATNTTAPQSTNTPKPTSTNAPVSNSTNTLLPTWTNTTQPTATNTPIPTATDTPPPTPTNTSPPPQQNDVYYVDGNLGSDSNPGTFELPWKTIPKALKSLEAGDKLYIRGGMYQAEWHQYFANSGTASKPITVTNYPGEVVTIYPQAGKGVGWSPFVCWAEPDYTPKADHIHIIGTDGGLILEGNISDAAGIWGAGDCDYWEVAGVTFSGFSKAIFQKKYNEKTDYSYSPDYWHIHDNTVLSYNGEVGFQIAGNYNVIEDNEINKTLDIVNQYGCSGINILGHHNEIRNNTILANGSNASCLGVLFEWDLADYNIVENNFMYIGGWGNKGYVNSAGGDNNIVRNNEIIGSADIWYYNWKEAWPEPDSIIPSVNNPDAPYYYPHDSKSVGNQIYENSYHAP